MPVLSLLKRPWDPATLVLLINISGLLWRPLMALMGNCSIPLLKSVSAKNAKVNYTTLLYSASKCFAFFKARILKINSFNLVYIVVGFLGALNILYNVIYFANALKVAKIIYIHHRKIIT